VLQPVPRRPLSAAVFEQLREEILGGGLAAGAKLPPERALCEAFGVNRGAVREALRRLEQARLVSIHHGGTSQVLDYRRSAGLDLLSDLIVSPTGRVDPDAVRGLMEVRSALAPDIARLAALRAHASDAAALGAIVADMRAAPRDPARLQRLAIDFWARLVEASRNVAYRLAWNTLRQAYARCLPLLTGVLAEENGDLRAHAAIAGAIERRDAPAAERRARALVRVGEASLGRALDRLDPSPSSSLP
jgi:DNA-binding FadR family transcriptional regulator